MKQSVRFWRAFGITLCTLATTSPTIAQIVPDATLPNNSNVTHDGNTSIINGGTQAGGNLFHSFEQFSVPNGSAAYFNNALDIQNIISRVTGSSISNIDGLIRANGTANLFLLNPNGIIFGPNASLNIGGSFLGSTASGLNFADGTQFSATTPPPTPLLTVSVPIGLQFGGTARSILNQSQATNSRGEAVGLALQPGKTLALVGGDVQLDGGFLQAPGGRVDLGGVAGAGTVGLNVDGSNLRLSFPGQLARSSVLLTNRSVVNVRAGGGGSIAINAQNLDIVGGSRLWAGIDSRLGSIGSVAGDIEINALGKVNLTNQSSIVNDVVDTDAVGNGGDINVTTGSLSVSNGAQLSANTFGRGDGGSVNIYAGDTVSFEGVGSNGASSGAFSNVERTAVGNSGNINITTGSLAVTNGAGVSVSSQGPGNAGNLEIVSRALLLDNRGAIRATTESASEGGNITLRVQDLILMRNNSEISITAGPGGNSGNLVIITDFLIASENSDLILNLEGEGGNLNVATQGFFLSPDSDIIVSSGEEFQWQNPDPLGRNLAAPPEVVNVTGLIATGCSALGDNKFIVTGRGGLPPSPSDTLSSDTVWTDLRSPTQFAEARPSSSVATQPTNPATEQLVEAQGWVINNLGEVVLTAHAPNVTPNIPWITPATCHTP